MSDEMSAPPEGLDEFLAQPAPSANLQDNVPNAPASTPAGLDEFIAPELKEAKYGGLGQQALAGLEGAAKGVAGPLAPMAEQALGVKSEDILGREEENPVTSAAGEVAGLAGSTMAGAGVGSALAKVGEAADIASKAIGFGRVGSAIAKTAVENAVFQLQEEGSKLALGDPKQSVDTAITDIGLAGLVGGAFGAAPSLWHATLGPKAGEALQAITTKLGGVDGVVPEATQDMIARTGMDIAPEVRAGLSQDPQIQQMFKTLQQSDTTKSGQALQQSFDNFRKDAGDALVSAFGKTPEEVNAIGDISKYDAGKSIGKTLADEYERQVTPISKSFDDLKNKFKNVELPESKLGIPGTTDQIADKISQRAIEEGWTASPSSDIMKEVSRVMEELPLQKNLKNLGDFITQVGNNTNKDIMNGPLRRAGGIMNSIMREAEADIITTKLGQSAGPEAVEAFRLARSSYAAQSALKEALDSRLHAGGSTSGFAKSLREMAQTDGESVLRRLSGTGDADLLNFLQQNYPETAALIRNHHINDLLKAASDKAKPGMTVNSEALMAKYNKLSPELKSFLVPPEGQGKMAAVEHIIDQFNSMNHNTSNTARTLDKLLQYVPGSAVGLVALLGSHSPATALISGALAKTLGKDIPDAARLALLKFLGSSQRVDAAGFKKMADMIQHTMDGERLTTKALDGLFKGSAEVIPIRAMPTPRDRKILERAVADSQEQPEDMLNVAGDTGHYMPEHAVAIGQTAAGALQFLHNVKPDTAPKSPLDTKQPMSPMQRAEYDRILNIAQQPLMVIKHMADGTLTPKDVAVMRQLYPSLYNRIAAKLMDKVSESGSNGKSVPYKTRMGLSLFFGQAMDSTMSPASITAAQPKPEQNQPQTATQPASNPKRSTASLNKIPKMYATPGQVAEQDRANRDQ